MAGRVVHAEATTNEAVWLRENLKSHAVIGGIRWRSIMKFKGLESEVIVITDLGRDAQDFFEKIGRSYQDAVYVGITRAKTKCIVLVQDDQV